MKQLESKTLAEQLAAITAKHKEIMKANPMISSIWYEIKDIPFAELQAWAKENKVGMGYCEVYRAMRVQASASHKWKDPTMTLFIYSRKGTVKESYKGFAESGAGGKVAEVEA